LGEAAWFALEESAPNVSGFRRRRRYPRPSARRRPRVIKHAGTNADESVGMGEIEEQHTDQAPASERAPGSHEGPAPGPHRDRAPGQYARASARRLRLRTLLVLGVFAVATALIGRALGVHDDRFLGATEGLLLCMFAVSRVVLPIVDRRDRGASAEEHVGWLLDALPAPQWRVVHDA